MNDLVSIITPSYNTAKYIGETIESVIQQTYTNWQLIIVDDCSEDNTDLIVSQYLKDERIQYIKNEKRIGAAGSRNKALQKAKGQWIAFLDSDDVWLPEKLEKQLKFMRQNGYHFSYTEYEIIDENSEKQGIRVSGPARINRLGMYSYCWPGCLTVMYNVEHVGMIQIKEIQKNNDYAMWIRVCRKAKCYLLKENLANYRKRSGSISNQNYVSLLKWHYILWNDAEAMNTFMSLALTGVNLLCGVMKKIIYVKRRL